MSNFDDLPIIQLRPTPSDAELEAERDAKYQAELRKWEEDDEWPIGEVIA